MSTKGSSKRGFRGDGVLHPEWEGNVVKTDVTPSQEEKPSPKPEPKPQATQPSPRVLGRVDLNKLGKTPARAPQDDLLGALERTHSNRPQPTTEMPRDIGASIVMVVEEETGNVVIVQEINRDNAFWKFPGGTRRPNETYEVTAQREVYDETGRKSDETGIWIDPSQLVLVDPERNLPPPGQRPRDRYYPAAYMAIVSREQFAKRGEVGDENGDPMRVRVVHITEIPKLPGFLRYHRERYTYEWPRK